MSTSAVPHRTSTQFFAKQRKGSILTNYFVCDCCPHRNIKNAVHVILPTSTTLHLLLVWTSLPSHPDQSHLDTCSKHFYSFFRTTHPSHLHGSTPSFQRTTKRPIGLVRGLSAGLIKSQKDTVLAIEKRQ